MNLRLHHQVWAGGLPGSRAGALLMLVLGCLTGNSAESTNAAPRRTDYSSFKLITDRNIFNPNRTSRSGRYVAPVSTRRASRVESFSLTGILSYDKGLVAIFDGTSSSYHKALKAGEVIAGYTVEAITTDIVRLKSGDKQLDLFVGSGLRREDGGDWHFSSLVESYAAADGAAVTTTSTSTSAAPGASSDSNVTTKTSSTGSSGGADDALKRLLERRAKENSK